MARFCFLGGIMMQDIIDTLAGSATYYSLYQLLFFFVIYSIGGWCLEVAYHVVTMGKFVNRGFLNGPYCPIYGFGMIFVIVLLMPLKERPLLLFLGSVVLTTALEFFTGFILEKVFHDKWWNYSEEPFNVKGYICLRFSLLWGLACMMVVDIIHVFFERLVTFVPFIAGAVLLFIILAIMLADAVVTVLSIHKLHLKIRGMDEIASAIRSLSDNLGENIYEVTVKGMELGSEARENISEKYEEFGQIADEKYGELGRRAEETRDQISKRAEETRDQISKKAVDTRDHISRKVGETYDQLGQLAEGAQAEFNRRKTNLQLERERKRGEKMIEQAQKKTEWELFLSEGENAAYAELIDKLRRLTEEHGFGQDRLMKAFPHLSQRYDQELDKLKKQLRQRAPKKKNSEQRKSGGQNSL